MVELLLQKREFARERPSAIGRVWYGGTFCCEFLNKSGDDENLFTTQIGTNRGGRQARELGYHRYWTWYGRVMVVQRRPTYGDKVVRQKLFRNRFNMHLGDN